MAATEILYGSDSTLFDGNGVLDVQEVESVNGAPDGSFASASGTGTSGNIEVGPRPSVKVPDGAIITGYEIYITHKSFGGGVVGFETQLRESGVLSETRSITGFTNTSFVTSVVGGPSDLMGNAFNAGNVNQSGFNVLVKVISASGASPVHIDSIGLKIYYTFQNTGSFRNCAFGSVTFRNCGIGQQ